MRSRDRRDTPAEGRGERSSTRYARRLASGPLRGSLICDPTERKSFHRARGRRGRSLRREVASLLAAHDRAGDDFLERPAAEALEGRGAPPPPIARLVNALDGRYEIERELARGGMATVFLARDVRHDRPVAIKVLGEELAAAVGAERFLEEIRVTASLQHPSIVPLFDSGSADGICCTSCRSSRSRRAPRSRAGEPAYRRHCTSKARWRCSRYEHRNCFVNRDVKPKRLLRV